MEDRMYDRDSGRRSLEETFSLVYSVEEKERLRPFIMCGERLI
jgi:hypothetical protein